VEVWANFAEVIEAESAELVSADGSERQFQVDHAGLNPNTSAEGGKRRSEGASRWDIPQKHKC
jgi:hypothetical protein